MEEMIEKYFCTSCKNKSKNCMKIKIVKSNNVITYKCVNYIIPKSKKEALNDFDYEKMIK